MATTNSIESRWQNRVGSFTSCTFQGLSELTWLTTPKIQASRWMLYPDGTIREVTVTPSPAIHSEDDWSDIEDDGLTLDEFKKVSEYLKATGQASS